MVARSAGHPPAVGGTASSAALRGRDVATAVLATTHPGPALAVTLLACLLAVADGQPSDVVGLVTAAVLTGQLTVGWVNDLVDRGRDRQVGRADKPLATGAVSARLVRGCLVVAAAACVVLSLLLGWRSGLVHLVVCLGAAHAYNLGLKSTIWSWAPYALAFGALPAVVTLADPPWSTGSPTLPAAWLVAAAAALGVAAHVLNALPDLDDDAATGVRGLPHRLGPKSSRLLAVALLLNGSVLAVLGPPGAAPVPALLALVVVLVLSAVVLLGRGQAPFRAAVAIALVDVALLVVMS